MLAHSMRKLYTQFINKMQQFNICYIIHCYANYKAQPTRNNVGCRTTDDDRKIPQQKRL